MLLPKKDTWPGLFPLSGWLPNIPYLAPANIQLFQYIYYNLYTKEVIYVYVV